MLTDSEQRELFQLGQYLRDADHGFARRLAILQGVLRWAAPGRQRYLLAAVALASALLRPAAAAARLLTACVEAVVVTESVTVMVLGDMAWLDWEPGKAPSHGSFPARGRPWPRGKRDGHEHPRTRG
ncbi:MAG: hypothetical protein ACRDRJ_28180 [Streptosporangiaceae bacterium]